MILLDVNILLYAYNSRAPQHERAKRWLEEILSSGTRRIGLPWLTIWAFLRIGTNPRAMPRPMTAGKAFEIVGQLLESPRVLLVNPGPRHAELLRRLVIECQVKGPLLTDAVLAALALEQGAKLASTDHDFSRFPELQWFNPLADKTN